MNRKIKIAFFITSTVYGGSEIYLLRFLTFFKDRIEPVIYCKGGYEDALSDDFRKIGADVKKLRLGYLPFLDFFRCYRELRRWNPDVVCDFTGDFSGFVMFCARLTGIKIRIAQYRNSSLLFKKTFLRFVYWKGVHWLTKENSTRFVANSNAALDFYFPNRSPSSQKFKVVYNGVESKKVDFIEARKKIRVKHNLPDSAFVVGHIGNYRPAKNHSVLVEAASRLCVQDPNIYFLCCGKGVEQEYGNILEKRGISSQVICPGSVSNVWEYLCAMDAFCFPSVTEGQSNALIEAMLANLPFVASDIPANRETVPPDLLSELVEPSDVDAYCERILKIKECSTYSESLKRSQWVADRYDPQRRFEEMFQALTEDIVN